MHYKVIGAIFLLIISIGLTFLSAWIGSQPTMWWHFAAILWLFLSICASVIGCIALFCDYFINDYD